MISVAADPARRDYLVLYNPVILRLDGEPVEGPEGSVSMPGFEASITRPPRAHIAYDDEAGMRHELQLEGLPARIAQHEIDQVDGIFFLDRLSRLKRDMALRRWKKASMSGTGAGSRI